MFHWDRLPVLSKSIELFFPFQKEKKKEKKKRILSQLSFE